MLSCYEMYEMYFLSRESNFKSELLKERLKTQVLQLPEIITVNTKGQKLRLFGPLTLLYNSLPAELQNLLFCQPSTTLPFSALKMLRCQGLQIVLQKVRGTLQVMIDKKKITKTFLSVSEPQPSWVKTKMSQILSRLCNIKTPVLLETGFSCFTQICAGEGGRGLSKRQGFCCIPEVLLIGMSLLIEQQNKMWATTQLYSALP